jgi:hypothetical protein
VARDGIEPPTPAFSGLDSPRVIALKTKGKGSLSVPKTAHLLGQEWDKILAGQNCLPIAVQLRHSISAIARETPADVDLNGKEDTRRYHATRPLEIRSRPKISDSMTSPIALRWVASFVASCELVKVDPSPGSAMCSRALLPIPSPGSKNYFRTAGSRLPPNSLSVETSPSRRQAVFIGVHRVHTDRQSFLVFPVPTGLPPQHWIDPLPKLQHELTGRPKTSLSTSPIGDVSGPAAHVAPAAE